MKFWSSVRLEVRRAETVKIGTDAVGCQTKVKVVNIQAPVELYELSDGSAPDWAGLKEGYESALAAFEAGELRKATRGLGALLELERGGPLCDGGPPFAVAARIAGGTVVALLVVHVPACG